MLPDTGKSFIGTVIDSHLHDLFIEAPLSGYMFGAVEIAIGKNLIDVQTSEKMKDTEIIPIVHLGYHTVEPIAISYSTTMYYIKVTWALCNFKYQKLDFFTRRLAEMPELPHDWPFFEGHLLTTTQ